MSSSYLSSLLRNENNRKEIENNNKSNKKINLQIFILTTYQSHSKLMACQQCNFSTNSQEDLTNHNAQMHHSPINDETKYPIWNDDDDDNNVRCFICNQDFPDRGAFKVHMESHMKWISCHFCKFKSHNSDAMQQHIITAQRCIYI